MPHPSERELNTQTQIQALEESSGLAKEDFAQFQAAGAQFSSGTFVPGSTTPDTTVIPEPQPDPNLVDTTEPDPETTEQVRDLVTQNLTAPQLPEGAIQEPVKLQELAGLDSDLFKVASPTEVTAQQAEVTPAIVPSTVAFDELQATLLDPNITPEVRAATIGSIREIEAQRAELTNFTEFIKGTVQPQDLAKLITMDIPEKAFVQTQLDGLLSGLSEGKIPDWAQPAVAQAEAMLASRGMAISNVGQQGMFNAIITAAMPIAQADARTELAVFQQELSQAQQTELHNSKFFQTMNLTNLNNEQQAAMLDATNLVQIDLANASLAQQAQVANAKNFLQRDMANQSAEQQAAVLNAQMQQQTLLSNQAAENTAANINATNRLQADKFNANLAASIDQFNSQQATTISQFNAGEANAASKFNTQMEAQRDQFNTSNAIAIEQNNLQWRREANKIDTATENAINQANAMNVFNLSNQSLAFLWGEMRDNAKMVWEGDQREDDRKNQLAMSALGNEQAASEDKYGLWKTVGTFAYDLFRD